METPEKNKPEPAAPTKRLELFIPAETWQSIEKAVNELNFVQPFIKYTPRLLVEELIEANCNMDEFENLINGTLHRVDAFIVKQREELKAKRLALKERKKE